jgi:predicted metal-dependent enzyme (double-stranded beta helix superfamily)
MAGFEVDRFVAECRAAVARDDGPKAVREVVARAVADPGGVMRALGEPKRAQLQKLHVSPELTVLHLLWGPHMVISPHNHNTWAVIGIYTGREDNLFWRRLPGDAKRRVEAAGAKALGAGDCVPLGRDIVHSVVNPIPRLTGAIHVYGGDFFAIPRSMWDAETLAEGVYDSAETIRLFEESNARLAPA